MSDEASPPALSVFVVRFWRDWSSSAGQWRGRIEHVQSGERATFSNWQQVVRFVQRFGIQAEPGDVGEAA